MDSVPEGFNNTLNKNSFRYHFEEADIQYWAIKPTHMLAHTCNYSIQLLSANMMFYSVQ